MGLEMTGPGGLSLQFGLRKRTAGGGEENGGVGLSLTSPTELDRACTIFS